MYSRGNFDKTTENEPDMGNAGSDEDDNYEEVSEAGMDSHAGASLASSSRMGSMNNLSSASGGVRDRRREAHTIAEQRRRDAIKKGYDELFALIPSTSSSSNRSSNTSDAAAYSDDFPAAKVSKATILQRSIEYIQYLERKKAEEEAQLQTLRNEVNGIRIMNSTLESIAKSSSRNAPADSISPEVKFALFEELMMRELSDSFDTNLSANTFLALSQSIFPWLERAATPEHMQELCDRALARLPALATEYERTHPHQTDAHS